MDDHHLRAASGQAAGPASPAGEPAARGAGRLRWLLQARAPPGREGGSGRERLRRLGQRRRRWPSRQDAVGWGTLGLLAAAGVGLSAWVYWSHAAAPVEYRGRRAYVLEYASPPPPQAPAPLPPPKGPRDYSKQQNIFIDLRPERPQESWQGPKRQKEIPSRQEIEGNIRAGRLHDELKKDPLAGSAHIGGEYLSWKDMVHKTFGKGHTTYAGRHRKKPSAKQLAEPALPREKKKKPKKAEATADEEEAGGGPTAAAGEEGAERGADEWKE